jgi:spermidine synthase
MSTVNEVARAAGVTGEVVLRRRAPSAVSDGSRAVDGVAGQPVDELIVNGTFAMDSSDTTSERRLAQLAFHGGRAVHRVLVGGLGLGYTVNELLRLGAGHVDVVEIEPALADWAYRGLTPTLAAVAADPRVRVVVADVAMVLTRSVTDVIGTWDAILLDVDNGPDFLISDANAGLYTAAGLRAAYERLSPGGVLAIWCQDRSPTLHRLCQTLGPTVAEQLVRTVRGDRELQYAIYTLTWPRDALPQC